MCVCKCGDRLTDYETVKFLATIDAYMHSLKVGGFVEYTHAHTHTEAKILDSK